MVHEILREPSVAKLFQICMTCKRTPGAIARRAGDSIPANLQHEHYHGLPFLLETIKGSNEGEMEQKEHEISFCHQFCPERRD